MRAVFVAAGLISLAGWSSLAAQPDYRPKFDKSDYVGSVGVQVNPWFPLNKPAVHALGGPNRAWKHYTGKDIWAQGMRDLLPYGVNKWVPEINEPTSYIGTWREFVRQATTNDVPVKIGMFYGLYSNTDEKTLAELKKQLTPNAKDLAGNPRISRAGGHPVLVVYNALKHTPEDWGKFFAKADAELGRMVYLLDVATFAWKASIGGGGNAGQDTRFEKLLRDYLPYCDGLSGYGNGCRIPWKIVRKVMDDYPQKLYEGIAHFTYTCHFHMGGCDVDLSQSWRDHLEACLESNPDAILLTNLFDHYENSLVMPCYDREDFVLRYFECRAEKWRKKPFRRLTRPELVVTGHTVIQLGPYPLEFEVLGFPIRHAQNAVTLHLELCDTAGKVLHAFPARKMKLDGGVQVERFSVPSVDFAKERGVVPHLRYDWAGGRHAMNYGPMTVIDPSLRGYRMYWARSTKNELFVNGKNAWTMDGVGPGGTHHPQYLGQSYVEAAINPRWDGAEKERLSASRFGLKRDGIEWYYCEEGGKGPNGALTISTPSPGSALHWYYLEMENAYGCKYQTLPIWETSGRRNRVVKLPVLGANGAIVETEVEDVRVPFWYYPVKENNGRLLVDLSGWGHNGAVRGSGYGGGHLGYTGYNHYHNGLVGGRENFRSLFRKDADGGYLTFNGSNDYVSVMGGTAFPGASTYEFRVRPMANDKETGIIGTGGGQVALDLLPDGTLKVSRKDADKTMKSFVSSVRLVPGEWAKVVVVYDLRDLVLYVNGAEAGRCAVKPKKDFDFYNNLILGAKCAHPWTPKAFFKGDMMAIRISGRNLAPNEFLK